MNKLTQKIKKTAVDFWKDEDAQGMLEYILIAVAVVAAVTIGGNKIKSIISSSGDKLEGSVSEVNF